MADTSRSSIAPARFLRAGASNGPVTLTVKPRRAADAELAARATWEAGPGR